MRDLKLAAVLSTSFKLALRARWLWLVASHH